MNFFQGGGGYNCISNTDHVIIINLYLNLKYDYKNWRELRIKGGTEPPKQPFPNCA